jgi:hypothetical protein
MSKRRKLSLLASMAILAVADAFSPSSARATTLGSCAWCTNSCPGDLFAFCANHCGGGGGNASCTTGGCRDMSGHFWDYTVSCGNAS